MRQCLDNPVFHQVFSDSSAMVIFCFIILSCFYRLTSARRIAFFSLYIVGFKIHFYFTCYYALICYCHLFWCSVFASQLTTVALSNWDQYLFYMLSLSWSSSLFSYMRCCLLILYFPALSDQPFLQGALVLLENVCFRCTRIWDIRCSSLQDVIVS